MDFKSLNNFELKKFYKAMCMAVCQLYNDSCEEFCDCRCHYQNLCTWYHSVIDEAHNEMERRERNA